VGIATDDSWVRDYGPLFVLDVDGTVACHKFRFNAWGGKFEAWAHDAAAGQAMAGHLGLPCWSHEMVLEGGAIEVNGTGTLITTDPCVINPNRNPGMTREKAEAVMRATLGVRKVIWLPGGLTHDYDTDGHIDNLARFVAERVIVAPRAAQRHVDHAVLEHNWQVLSEARDAEGQPFDLIALPVPELMTYVYPELSDEAAHCDGRRIVLPASYANFLISNGHVFVPVFDQPADDVALRVMEAAMPGYTIVPMGARWLVVEGGALHCLTMQQPRCTVPTP
jgi:agmatine deiminase